MQPPQIRQYFKLADEPVDGGEWLTLSELPTSDEILWEPPSTTADRFTRVETVYEETKYSQKPSPRPSKLNGPYDDHEHYLQTQYELLREDCVLPLRKTVAKVRDNPFLNEVDYQGGSVGLYEPVYFTSMVFSPRGIATRVTFSLGRVQKRIRWDQSKRLITGTLVALTPADDAFRTTCVLATVAARPLSALEQNPPEIDLFIPDIDIDVDPSRKWIMVEDRASFFEAGRHTLVALQHLMRESYQFGTFPLAEHLVHVKQDVAAPSFVVEDPRTDLSPIVSLEDATSFENVDILNDWPVYDGQTSPTGLDRSQTAALERILTKRLAIVQGPPGTGKTYVSVQALKIKLANMRQGDPPIIVTCQTNHALDQLLRHIAPFEAKFVRLGGRSKDKDIVKSRTLYVVRTNTPNGKQSGTLKSWAWGEMRRLTNKMRTILLPLEANGPPLDHKLLKKLGLITQEQADSLEICSEDTLGISTDTPGIHMELWLGSLKIPSIRPLEPEGFGFEFEECDVEFEQLQELEAEAVAQDDDDIEALKGPVTLLSDNCTARVLTFLTDAEVESLLERESNLQSIRPKYRGAIYQYWQRKLKKIINSEFRVKAKRYAQLVQLRKIGLWEQDYEILKHQKVIGLTTTGLSKYRGLVASLQPKVVLVEEAAETLEPPLSVACVPSLEQLILVGDHKQLRPQCQVSEHENDPYYFNISLFERMVLNGIEFNTLTRQRRMIPEIRRLLRPIYGQDLKDHPSVKEIQNRPAVQGMGDIASFFMTHEFQETQDANMSFQNPDEAALIAGHYAYLVLNGIDPSKITVITFYNGQRKLIHRYLREKPDLNAHRAAINVVTVDSYQGEENDVVFLSLVRSNKRWKIGFTGVENRVCVALSRARRGFYIFGNGQLMASESGLWASVIEIMSGKKGKAPENGPKRRIGYMMPLTCKNHQHKTWVQCPLDWEQLNGGCLEPCNCILPCGHPCMLRCHPFEAARINCTRRCAKMMPCGHICSALCCDACHCDVCRTKDRGGRSLVKTIDQSTRMTMNSAPQSIIPSPHRPVRRILELPPVTSASLDEDEEMDISFLDSSPRKKSPDERTATTASDCLLVDLTPELPPPRSATKAVDHGLQPVPSSADRANLLIDLGPDVQPLPRRFVHKQTVVVHPTGEAEIQESPKPKLNLLD